MHKKETEKLKSERGGITFAEPINFTLDLLYIASTMTPMATHNYSCQTP
jgi:hypothetical protein